MKRLTFINIFKCKKTILIITLLFIVAIGYAYQYNEEKIILETRLNDIDSDYKEAEWMLVDSILDLTIIYNDQDANHISDLIEKNIRLTYPNINDLESDFNKDTIANTEIPKIIYDTIKNNNTYWISDLNDSLAIFSDGFVIDYVLYDISKKPLQNWDEYKKIDLNDQYPILLNKKPNERLFLFLNRKYDNYRITNLTKEDIYNIYKTYGISGLKNYKYISVAHITPDGDIFGNKSYEVNKKMHKITIVKEVSIYDIIEDHFNYLIATSKEHTENEKKNAIAEYNTQMIKYLAAFVTITSVLILTLFILLQRNGNKKQ